MKISNGFFHIKNVREKGKGKLKLEGTLTMDATTTVSSSASASPSKIKLLKVKYILPPKGSPFYDRVKDAAESAGYETVEHDDFSYPRG